MVLQFAFALALGSILAWGFAIGWILVNMRRVRLEEVHLRKLFGVAYVRYCARTPRFIPGAYLFLRQSRESGD
jgi:protein-S-isoprenylcysteine O-methyltransferase Ste14